VNTAGVGRFGGEAQIDWVGEIFFGVETANGIAGYGGELFLNRSWMGLERRMEIMLWERGVVGKRGRGGEFVKGGETQEGAERHLEIVRTWGPAVLDPYARV
jgi:hypothetical protein